jgi:hypothetical protein
MILLKADQYPDIIIEVPYEHLLNVFSGKACRQHRLYISIAGVTNSYVIPGSANFCAGDIIYITGSNKISVTDFDLNLPKRLNGLINVENEVLIDFGFVFQLKNLRCCK